jgi:hypothetical protein
MCYLLFILRGEGTFFQVFFLQYMNEYGVNLLCWNAYKICVCNICVHVAHFILHILISFQVGEFFSPIHLIVYQSTFAYIFFCLLVKIQTIYM